MQPRSIGSRPPSAAIRVVVVDPGRIIDDDTWSVLASQHDVDIVARLCDADRLARLVERLQLDAAIVVVADHGADPSMISEVARHARPVAVVDDDAVRIAQALRAGARAVVARSSLATGEIGEALRAVSAGRAHLSTSVAGALAGGFRDLQLRIAGEASTRLTQREREVMQLVAAGMTNPQIAARLSVSRKTVKNHLTNIYGKLGAHERAAAVRAWRRAAPPTP